MDDRCLVAAPTAPMQEVFAQHLDQKMRQLAQSFVQTALECLRDQAVALPANERSPQRKDYRNGYYPRRLGSLHGPLELRVPRCRTRPLDCSMVFGPYRRRMTDVDRVLRRAYLLGASTRDDAELAEQIFGGSLSPQSISNLMKALDQDLAACRRQPIQDVYPYVFIDGMHVHMRGQDRTVVLLVLGMKEDRTRHVLDFRVGAGESCGELLQSLRQRGLQNVRLFISDDSAAIRSALADQYPEVPWQYCAFHRLADLRKKIGPQPCRHAIVHEAARVFRCPSRPAALETADRWRRRWKDTAPFAVQSFLDGLRDSLTFYDLPQECWKKVRTNNPLERTIRTLRVRLRPMNVFANPAAVERAVFGQLARRHLLPPFTQSS
jgi:putative transposase